MAGEITALAVTSEGSAPAVRQISMEPPRRGEVLVRICASGLCHTDLRLMDGPHPYVLGHEGAGVIERAGDGVELQVGTPVVLNWAMPCGTCFQCSIGALHRCERRSPVLALGDWEGPPAPLNERRQPIPRAFGLGTMSTRTVVPESAVWPLPPGIPFPSAAILGCGVMTGVGSVLNVARVAAGDRVAVIGCGGVGLSAIQAARLAGASLVVGVDRLPDRCALAEQLGATTSIRPDDDDADLVGVARTIRELTSGRGVDHAFECTGVARLATAPLRMIRHGGTAVQISGFDQPVTIDLSLFMFDKVYVNPLYGHCVPARDFPRLLDLYRQGVLRLDDMVTRIYTVDEVQLAFDDLRAGRNAKGVLILE